jgi:WD40 repeat protein
VTADEDGVARMWDVSTGTQHLSVGGPGNGSAGLTDDGHVVTVRPDGRILRRTADGRETQVVAPRLGGFAFASFSADGTHAVAFTFKHSRPELVWVTLGRRRVVRLTGPNFQNLSISADGRDVLVWGTKRLRIFHDGRPRANVPLTKAERRNGDLVDLSKDAQSVLISRYGGGARIVDIDGGREVPLHTAPGTHLASADFSPDGTQLVTSGRRGAFIWDTTSGSVIAPLGDNASPVESAVFSRPDGRDIAALDSHGVIRIFDAASRTETSALAPHPGVSFGLTYNSDSKTALLIGESGVDLRVCESCQPADWLARHALERVTRTPAEVASYIEEQMRR